MSDTTQVQAQIKLNAVIIQVPDVQALDTCRDWYIRLGLTPQPWDQPGESYWFDLGNEVPLGIHTGSTGLANGFEIYLSVVDIDETHASLTKAGFEFETAPETKFWGRSASLRDPAGSKVVLVSPPPADTEG